MISTYLTEVSLAPSKLEVRFFENWCKLRGQPLVDEFRFNAPRSRHRFDFAHLSTLTAMEVEGGTFVRGRHTRGVGFRNDCIKYNLASSLGWRVFRFDTRMVGEDDHYNQVIRFIQSVEVRSMPELRPRTAVDVLVYKPIAIETEESGFVRAAYSLALLNVAGHSYLLDPYGVGTEPLDTGGCYNQPVYGVATKGAEIPYRASVVGCFWVGQDHLQILEVDRTMDLADFIVCTEIGEYRLERWARFVREERARVITD